MARTIRVAISTATVLVAVLGWGFWHASTHAALHIAVDDYGLATDRSRFGIPHDTRLEFFGANAEALAEAHSVEPLGYVLALHPDPAIGNCAAVEEQIRKGTSTQRDYARCFDHHSRWAASWAPKVRTATVAIGPCIIRAVPVTVSASTSGWWLWWIPLPHVGGVPYSYVEMTLSVDSRNCKAAS